MTEWLHFTSQGKKPAENTNMWRLNNVATKQPVYHWRNQRGNQKYPETNENRNTTIRNLWDATEEVLRG